MNERAADVVVADEAELERDARRLAESESSGVRRVGHAEHAVRIGRVLERELAAERAARAIHARAEDARVGAREVDQLEDARRLAWRGRQRLERLDRGAPDAQHRA